MLKDSAQQGAYVLSLSLYSVAIKEKVLFEQQIWAKVSTKKIPKFKEY